MIDFSKVTNFFIPEGEVQRAMKDSSIVWEKSGYVETEYVQFDGKTQFDSGIYGNINTKIECKWSRDYAEVGMYIYGCASSGNTSSITAYTSPTGGSWRFGSRSLNPFSSCDTDIHVTVHDRIGITRNDSTAKYSTVSSFTTPYTILIGNAHNASGDYSVNKLTGKIYYFKLWDSDELILDLIPVKRNGVDMFFDTVSGSFIRPVE